MHEMAIAEQILRTALPAVKDSGASRILEIRVSIGVLSGVIPSYLEHALRELSRGTPAEGARLAAEFIPPQLSCKACGRESEGRRGLYVCPLCGSEDIRLTGGSGYRLTDLLVE